MSLPSSARLRLPNAKRPDGGRSAATDAVYDAWVDRLLASPSLRRTDGRRLARLRPLCRHQRLSGRSRPRDVGVARLGDRRLQREPAVRPIHRSNNSPATCCPSRRSSRRSRPAFIATTCSTRKAAHPGGVPGRILRRPRGDDGDRLARADVELLPLPRSQVRSRSRSETTTVCSPSFTTCRRLASATRASSIGRTAPPFLELPAPELEASRRTQPRAGEARRSSRPAMSKRRRSPTGRRVKALKRQITRRSGNSHRAGDAGDADSRARRTSWSAARTTSRRRR